MFDALSSQLLRSAPNLPDLNANDIPQILTRHYAELVSARLKGENGSVSEENDWPLEQIADAYEIIASIEENSVLRRAAAFVAATAQQIIARRAHKLSTEMLPYPINRDSVDASISAALLFLVAEQYADANEAGAAIPLGAGPYELKILRDHIRDLVQGHLDAILQRAARWRREGHIRGTIQNRALRILAATLSEGIELLAARMMSAPVPDATPKRFANAQEAFYKVISLTTNLNSDLTDMLVVSSQGDLSQSLLKGLSAAVRRGFDTVQKLEFANTQKGVLGRVQMHKLYQENLPFFDLDNDDEI